MRVARCHPLLGWLRLDAPTYSKTLDQSLFERDRALEIDRNHTGHAESFIDWVWTTQLPSLVRKDSYRKQINEHCSDLERRSELISHEINSKVGSLLQQQSEIDIERQKLLALLEE